MSLNRSDVVFMSRSPVETYRRHGATLVGWGGLPWDSSASALTHFREQVRSAHDAAVRYAMGVPFRTAFAPMIDFDPDFMDSVCRALDGEPITVPWLWDHEHKGHPAYWFCTNAPGSRAFLKHLAKLGTSAEVDGLHIDDYNGTAGTEWVGGCFCPWCMKGFCAYLKDNLSQQELEEVGITTLDGFDYGEFLRSRGVTRDEFTRSVNWNPPVLPLTQEYLTFQYASATAWVAEFRRYVEELAGRPLPLSVNSSASDPKSLVIAPVLTYFCGEVPHHAESGEVCAIPVFSYKLGDALARPIACTAAGQDWAYVADKHLPGLVRTWIAQAYAYGHQIMAPVRQWAYTKDKGTHWYEACPGDYDYLYRFVRDHASLFDGYDAVAQVGLLYGNAAFRRGQRGVRDACVDLALDNVPFRMVIAGDDWLPNRLQATDPEGLKALVVVEPTDLDPDQQAVVKSVHQRTVIWPDKERLFELLPRQIVLENASNVTVVPRASHDPGAPFVCHLFNRDYTRETDSMEKQRNFTLRLAKSLFGADIRSATLYAPGHAPAALEITATGEWTEVFVPELDLWGVLKLERM